MQDPDVLKSDVDDALYAGEAPAPAAAPPQPAAPLSRLDRLKQKIRKLQTRNPDIYPMF